MKTVEEANANLAQSVAYIPSRYIAGVSRAEWATPAGSDQAEANFATKMAQVIARKTRQINIKKITNAEWQGLSVTKGGAVIGQRVMESLDKQKAKWNPIYNSVMSDVRRLQPRTTDFRQNITSRVVGTVEAWKKHSGKL